MKREDKELLFKDLCARLPYHTRVKIWLKDGTTEEGALDLEHNYADVLLDAFYYNKIKDIKPYLRPMSSMTEEELEELNCLCYHNISVQDDMLCGYICGIEIVDVQNFLLRYHFDFMGLIPKGLAIAVTEENNPYNITEE